MAGRLSELVRASGNAGSAGQSFRLHVAGSPANGTAVRDYLATGVSADIATAIPLAFQAPSSPPGNVASGSQFTVTLTLAGNAKLVDISNIGGGAGIDVDLLSVAGGAQVLDTFLNRAGLTRQVRLTFNGQNGALNSVSGAVTSNPATLTDLDEVFQARFNMTPSVTVGATSSLGFGLYADPDGDTFNEWQELGQQWFLSVLGRTPALDYRWTTNNLDPDSGGTVVASTQLHTVNGIFNPGPTPPRSSSIDGIVRYGWVRRQTGGAWFGTGALTFDDPRV